MHGTLELRILTSINIYGPPKGEAERFFGNILRHEFDGHRDQMVISTKAGWPMWDGPYGDFGSRKHLISSLDQSLSRMGLEYVDIFYHHRPDTYTPLEETMGALDHCVRQGKALYAGVSGYNAEQSRASFSHSQQTRNTMPYPSTIIQFILSWGFE